MEVFAGFGKWSKAHARKGLMVHPGMERDAVGKEYGDLGNKSTCLDLAKLAYAGAIREWHAAPPCWSFGTLRRSKSCPAGFNLKDKATQEQTCLAIRTAFLLFLAMSAGSFLSCEQPRGSVMFGLQIFQRLIEAGCQVTSFCVCSFGSAFQKEANGCTTKRGISTLEAIALVPSRTAMSLLRGHSLELHWQCLKNDIDPMSFLFVASVPEWAKP